MTAAPGSTRTVRVSDAVYEELQNRSYAGEPLEQVLKRLFGLAPETIEDLTAGLPTQLAAATTTIVTDYLQLGSDYHRVGSVSEQDRRLRFLREETDEIDFEVHVTVSPTRSQPYEVVLRVRTIDDELKRVAVLRNVEDGDGVDIVGYTLADTDEVLATTRYGPDAGARVAAMVGPEVATYLDRPTLLEPYE